MHVTDSPDFHHRPTELLNWQHVITEKKSVVVVTASEIFTVNFRSVNSDGKVFQNYIKSHGRVFQSV